VDEATETEESMRRGVITSLESSSTFKAISLEETIWQEKAQTHE